MFNIAICEDDDSLGHALVSILKDVGYDCALTTCSEELDILLSRQHPSLLILDNQLPGENGLQIAARLSKSHPNLNIIMMSVKADIDTRVESYKSGVMLYLAKPFEPADLLAAVNGIKKQYETSRPKGLILESSKLSLISSNNSVNLSNKEFTLLKLLAIRAPNLVENFELLEAISNDEELASKASLEVTISRLRKKLKNADIDRQLLNISSSHSLGYSLKGDITLS